MYTSFQLSTDPEFVKGLGHRFQRRKQAKENIEDVYDGILYKDQFLHGGFLSQPFNMSFKLNTDGVAVFKSSKFGVWPLFLSINELPPHLRYMNCDWFTCTILLLKSCKFLSHSEASAVLESLHKCIFLKVSLLIKVKA